jgi:hypothetical protein
MRESNEFYDVKISQDIISEKERNIITNNLMKNENVSDKQSECKQSECKQGDSKQSECKHWHDNKCFFLSVLILTSTILATCAYICFIFL